MGTRIIFQPTDHRSVAGVTRLVHLQRLGLCPFSELSTEVLVDDMRGRGFEGHLGL